MDKRLSELMRRHEELKSELPPLPDLKGLGEIHTNLGADDGPRLDRVHVCSVPWRNQEDRIRRIGGSIQPELNEIMRLRARLAEVEAERDAALKTVDIAIEGQQEVLKAIQDLKRKD